MSRPGPEAASGSTTQAEIYEGHADAYDALVSAEDVDRNLLPAIAHAFGDALVGRAVLEVGVGTGRITAQLLGAGVTRLVGVEPARPMLAIARARLAQFGPAPAGPTPHAGHAEHAATAGHALGQAGALTLVEGDARALPRDVVGAGWADLAIAGWVFGHFRKWMPDGWRTEVGQALSEMRRALKPGGTLVIIETLGTGRESPEPPNAGLAEYYAWLEGEQGLRRRAIRTDYVFADVASAARITGFFFGAAFGERVVAEGWSRIPECTGVWSGS